MTAWFATSKSDRAARGDAVNGTDDIVGGKMYADFADSKTDRTPLIWEAYMPEPDITSPPASVMEKAAALDAALDKIMPPREPGKTLRVGSWNGHKIAGLTKDWETPVGASPVRNFADLTYMSRFIRRCDVVALQEVLGNLRALRYLLKVLGDDWGFILTDITKGSLGNDERLAFLFDTRHVKLSGLACELVEWVDRDLSLGTDTLNRQFARTPYAVSFASSGQTFILVTLHINYGKHSAERIPELKAIADWVANWAEHEFDWDHNVVVLGDMNVDHVGDPLYEAFTSTGLTPAPQLENLPRTIFDKPAKPHYYDQIAWFTKDQKKRPVLNLDCIAGGSFDFVPELQDDQALVTLAAHISDHYPLWVEFAVPRL